MFRGETCQGWRAPWTLVAEGGTLLVWVSCRNAEAPQASIWSHLVDLIGLQRLPRCQRLCLRG
jgi:hypothetical protein